MFLLFFLFPLCFPCLPSASSLKGGPGVPGVSAFPAGCRFGPLLPGLHGPKPGLRHALCSLHERGGCSRCGGDVPAAPSSRCFRHRDTGVPNAELLSHQCPFPFPFPFCPLPTAGRKPRHKQDTCIVVQEVALSYAPAFWVICFYLLFLKKAKKKEKKVSPSPIPSPLPPSYLPEPNSSKICILIGKSLLSSSPSALLQRAESVLWTGEELWHWQGRGKGVGGRTEEMRGTGDLPRRDGIAKGWSSCGSIHIGLEHLVAQGGEWCWSQHSRV